MTDFPDPNDPVAVRLYFLRACLDWGMSDPCAQADELVKYCLGAPGDRSAEKRAEVLFECHQSAAGPLDPPDTATEVIAWAEPFVRYIETGETPAKCRALPE